MENRGRMLYWQSLFPVSKRQLRRRSVVQTGRVPGQHATPPQVDYILSIHAHGAIASIPAHHLGASQFIPLHVTSYLTNSISHPTPRPTMSSNNSFDDQDEPILAALNDLADLKFSAFSPQQSSPNPLLSIPVYGAIGLPVGPGEGAQLSAKIGPPSNNDLRGWIDLSRCGVVVKNPRWEGWVEDALDRVANQLGIEIDAVEGQETPKRMLEWSLESVRLYSRPREQPVEIIDGWVGLLGMVCNYCADWGSGQTRRTALGLRLRS